MQCSKEEPLLNTACGTGLNGSGAPCLDRLLVYCELISSVFLLSLFSAQERMLPKRVLCDDMKLEE